MSVSAEIVPGRLPAAIENGPFAGILPELPDFRSLDHLCLHGSAQEQEQAQGGKVYNWFHHTQI